MSLPDYAKVSDAILPAHALAKLFGPEERIVVAPSYWFHASSSNYVHRSGMRYVTDIGLSDYDYSHIQVEMAEVIGELLRDKKTKQE